MKLDEYLQMTGIKIDAFSKAVDIPIRTLFRMRKLNRATLEQMIKIKKATKGKVAEKDWLVDAFK